MTSSMTEQPPASATLGTVTSADGTRIAYERAGSGPPVILVCGGSVDRSSNAPLAALLAKHLTVFNYDRRGRGDSGDSATYAIQREIEDLAAMIEIAGGKAFVYGSSSGAALVLEAAASALPIAKLVLWEPPYMVDDDIPRPPANQAEHYRELVAAGRRGEAVEFFMSKVVGLPPEFVAQARQAPWWPAQEALAHTLAYDATIMGDYSLPTQRAASVMVPALVLSGTASFPWINHSAEALADILPHGQRRSLEGQTHDAAAEAIAPAMLEFLRG
jgi:pimeloyl-ACP methyl ester carboxylesterase